jgi:adenine phosphoribosyltransferase
VEARTGSWNERWRALIRDVPDFPEPGILFRDITPLLFDAEALKAANDAIAEVGRALDTAVVAAIEARGFFFGVPVAERLGVPFVPLRKAGKLPSERASASYALEYGSAELELHRDPPVAGHRVLIVDDVLATGGTAEAAVRLVRSLGGDVAGCAFMIGLVALNGHSRLDVPVTTLIEY